MFIYDIRRLKGGFTGRSQLNKVIIAKAEQRYDQDYRQDGQQNRIIYMCSAEQEHA